MADRAAREAWTQRVLGVDFALARSAARGREAQAVNPRGIAYPKLLLRWRAAQRDAVDALNRIGKSVLAMPDVQADPRFPRVKVVIARLPKLIPDMGGRA